MTETANNDTASPNHIHLIVSGETLAKIAARHDLKVAELLVANPQIKDPNRIMVGQRLKIPADLTSTAHAPVPVGSVHDVESTVVATSIVAAGMPHTSGKSEPEKYEIYGEYLARFGVKLGEMEADRRTILGLRVTSSTKVNQGQGDYNDRMVVIWQSSDGERHAREFESNTEPSARYEDTPENRRNNPKRILGGDGDGDGRRDLGCLPDGLFFFEKFRSQQFGKVLRPVQDIFVMRDVDHDGDFDDADKAKCIEARLNSAKSILFHPGGANITGSAGCQTMRPKVFRSFWEALGNQTRFQYVLATVK